MVDKATAEHYVSRVYRERGYLVVGTFKRFEIGEVIWDVSSYGHGLKSPFRIVAETTKEDWQAQGQADGADSFPFPRRALALLGLVEGDIFFYRIEAD